MKTKKEVLCKVNRNDGVSHFLYKLLGIIKYGSVQLPGPALQGVNRSG